MPRIPKVPLPRAVEALGARGIVRCIEYGAHLSRSFYDPTREESETSYGHFYEKLLGLASTMNTEPAKRLALARDAYMRAFLARYLQETHVDA